MAENPSDSKVAPVPLSERDRLRRLLEAARTLGSASDYQQALHQILAKAMEVMSAEASSVFLSDPATHELVMHAPQGSHASQLLSFRIPDDKGIAGSVFHGRMTVNVKDAQNDPRFFRGADKKSGFITRAVLCSPLLDQGNCLGVLQVLNPADRPNFDDDELDYFEGFSSLVTTTLLRLRSQEQEMLQKKLEQQLSIAREIQQSFLPREMPHSSCLRMGAMYQPAQDVGGDFYHVQQFEDGRVLLAVADVSGKGVPAALTMARATAEMRALGPPEHGELAQWFTVLNHNISRDLSAGRFITMCGLIVDPARATVLTVNAGHCQPWLRSQGVWKETPLDAQLPLGILSDTEYTQTEYQLQVGDALMIFSDGLPDARNAAGDEYDYVGMFGTLPDCSAPKTVLSGIEEQLKEFVGRRPPHDDITCMMAVFRGVAPEREMEIRSEPAQLCVARDWVESWAQFAAFDDLTVGQIVLAVDEAAANVIRYAYEGRADGNIQFSANVTESELEFVLRDFGKPCELSKIKGRELDDVRPGGLGTFLMAHAFTTVDYTPQKEGTVLTLRRALPE